MDSGVIKLPDRCFVCKGRDGINHITQRVYGIVGNPKTFCGIIRPYAAVMIAESGWTEIDFPGFEVDCRECINRLAMMALEG